MNEKQQAITAYSKNADIVAAYETELEIPQGANASRVVIFDIVERSEFAGIPGDNRKQLLMLQVRNDMRSASTGSFLTEGARDAFASLRADSSNFTRAIRVVGPPMSDKDLAHSKLTKGQSMESQFNVDTHRSTSPFYKGQEPMVYPVGTTLAGETITSDGDPVYESSFLCIGEPIHKGLDLVLDTAAVSSTVSVAG